MSNILVTVGWLGLAVALIYAIVYERYGDPANAEFAILMKKILMVSAGTVVLGYLAKFADRFLKIGKFSRCKKCGKKVDKGEMYCFDHRRDSIWQAKDRFREEGTGKFRRKSS